MIRLDAVRLRASTPNAFNMTAWLRSMKVSFLIAWNGRFPPPGIMHMLEERRHIPGETHVHVSTVR